MPAGFIPRAFFLNRSEAREKAPSLRPAIATYFNTLTFNCDGNFAER